MWILYWTDDSLQADISALITASAIFGYLGWRQESSKAISMNWLRVLGYAASSDIDQVSANSFLPERCGQKNA